MNTKAEHTVLGLPQLNDSCLGNIAAFMDPNESALISKAFLKVSGETATHLLATKLVDHPRDDDFIPRLKTKARERFYANNPTTAPEAIHRRLLLPCAGTIPLVVRRMPIIGPSVILPSGNIAIVCSEPDNMIRITDTRRMAVVMTAELGFTPVIEGAPINHMTGPIEWISNNLFYSDGYLVLHRSPMGAQNEWIHVWKLDEEQGFVQFLYTQRLSLSDETKALQDVAVAADLTMYQLWRKKQGNREISYTIESFDIATGRKIIQTTLPMPSTDPQESRLPRYTTATLIVAGNYLLMFRNIEEQGPYRGIGLGVYAFLRRDLSQSDFLPCLEDHEAQLNHDKSGQASQYLFYYEHDGVPGSACKKISINGTTGRLSVEESINFGTRSEVVLTTPGSVFTHDPDEEYLALDERDVESGKKLRTLEMGLPSANPHQVASVLASQERGEVFILTSAGVGGDHVLQTFML